MKKSLLALMLAYMFGAGAALAEDLIVPDANGGVWIYDQEYRILRYCRVGENGTIFCVSNRA